MEKIRLPHSHNRELIVNPMHIAVIREDLRYPGCTELVLSSGISVYTDKPIDEVVKMICNKF